MRGKLRLTRAQQEIVRHNEGALLVVAGPGSGKTLVLTERVRRLLREIQGQVALGSTQQSRRDGLALLTIHSAKGLEFDMVAVMGMAEGVFPDYRATGDALQEEQRNAFVAITRAKRVLILSYPKIRTMPWGQIWHQKPSRYLQTMGLVE